MESRNCVEFLISVSLILCFSSVFLIRSGDWRLGWSVQKRSSSCFEYTLLPLLVCDRASHHLDNTMCCCQMQNMHYFLFELEGLSDTIINFSVLFISMKMSLMTSYPNGCDTVSVTILNFKAFSRQI